VTCLGQERGEEANKAKVWEDDILKKKKEEVLIKLRRGGQKEVAAMRDFLEGGEKLFQAAEHAFGWPLKSQKRALLF